MIGGPGGLFAYPSVVAGNSLSVTRLPVLVMITAWWVCLCASTPMMICC